MNVSAIVCEYNPFHNGHAYHIKKTRDFGATHIIAIMSGNFVQRGDFAILPKLERAKMALLSGIDLVIELPVIWAISSAEFFANAAVKIADSLGLVDTLCFGSECNNIELLKKVSTILEKKEIKSLILQELKNGVNFPKARENVIRHIYGNELSDILSSPNNILAIEYIKSLNKINSSILPLTIKRICSGHDKKTIKNAISSASHIRDLIYNNKKYSGLMPESAVEIVKKNIQELKAPANIYFVETAILSKLRTMNLKELSNICDISEGLENRIYKSIKNATSLDELFSLIKTKRYPLSRIRRIILNAFLGITKRDLNSNIPYIRILGFNENGKQLLKAIKENSNLPIITKGSDILNLNESAKHIFALEQISTDLYNLATPRIQKCGLDVSQKIITIK